ncbi:calcium-binding protein [Roseivivax isoporae]|uniref:Calcium-binding protein n=1 Tax=Roseivivax isoporae LMG 25204 TaxID=1449351 RepID=X7F3N0_9RHOB|nr:calcium-binding protein [Roseivivax isoporae]ETX26649.1 hypothetical protein RISW2_20905 [Roseivivax isoporae LMG 25204]
MPASSILTTYRGNLVATRNAFLDIAGDARDLAEVLEILGDVIGGTRAVSDIIDDTRTALNVQIVLTKVLKYVPEPSVATAARSYDRFLSQVEPVIEEMDDKTDRLNGTRDRTPPAGAGEEEDGAFLDALEEALGVARQRLDEMAESLEIEAGNLTHRIGAFDEFVQAMDRVSDPDDPDGPGGAALHAALALRIDAQLAPRNADFVEIRALRDDIAARLDAIFGTLDDAALGAARAGLAGIEEIGRVFEDLRVPLTAVYGLLKPIEPLLRATDFLASLVVEPVLEFISESLGIDDEIAAAEAQIRALLPDLGVLDPLIAEVQDIQDRIAEFNDTLFDYVNYQQSALANLILGEALYGNAVGVLSADGPTGIGTVIGDVLTGNAAAEIIDGRAGDDTVLAGGGDDVVVAGEGDDTVWGGAGIDSLVFSNSFLEYELAREIVGGVETGRYIVTHKRPGPGTLPEGSETVDGVEHFVFSDIRFTREALDRAEIGGTPLLGDRVPGMPDDLMFLNSDNDPGDDPFGFDPEGVLHEAYGLIGDDTIFGSTANDRLDGGPGDDLLFFSLGRDVIVGNTGTDTYRILAGATGANGFVDLADGGARLAGTADTLSGIEDVVSQARFNADFRGDAGANVLAAAGGEDLLMGRGGDDVLLTGDGRDAAIGGEGVDALRTGAGSDLLVAGGARRPGGRELYDGGEGYDWLSFSNDEAGFNRPSGLFNTLQPALRTAASTPGPLEIRADLGEVRHLDARGRVFARDDLRNIEAIAGSPEGDLIHGPGTSGGPSVLWGMDGDDTIRSDGATSLDGGGGTNLYVITRLADAPTPGIDLDGGVEDIVDLREVAHTRWRLQLDGVGGETVRGHPTDVTGPLLNAGLGFQIMFEGVGTFRFGDGNDEVDFRPAGGFARTFLLGGGDDIAIHRDRTATYHGGDGDDRVEIEATGAAVYGEAGNDRVEVTRRDDAQILAMGTGNDLVVLARSGGTATGGPGQDTLSVTPRIFVSTGYDDLRVDVDLGLGTLEATARPTVASASETVIDMRLSSFEEVIGWQNADRIAGGAADERLVGAGGNDTLAGRGGNDRLFGGAGDDSLSGGEGDDTLNGGTGTDTIDGGPGRNTVSFAAQEPGTLDGDVVAANFGDVSVSLATGRYTRAGGSAGTLAGVQNVIGGAGDDTIAGDAGDNVLSGERGDDLVTGGDGDDVLTLGGGRDTVSGGAGADRMILGAGDGSIDGGAGYDVLEVGLAQGGARIDLAAGRFETVFEVTGAVWLDDGGDGARVFDGRSITPLDVLNTRPALAASPEDVARVLPGPEDAAFDAFRIRETSATGTGSGTFRGIEEVVGGAGADTILGTGTGDVLSGGAGGDTVAAGGGSDRVVGGAGADLLLAGDGADTVIGGAGNDTITGGASTADLRDVIYGGDGNDRIDGGYGNDELRGDAGNDSMAGGYGADTVIGGTGDDVITGSAFGDLIFGSDGMDFVNGGFGNDLVNGGAGADRFYHEGVEGHGSDWIQDFSDAEGDRMIWGGGVATAAQFQVNFASTARAGDAGVEEAFVIYRPTGQILWALVDGAGEDSLMLQIEGASYDLLA